MTDRIGGEWRLKIGLIFGAGNSTEKPIGALAIEGVRERMRNAIQRVLVGDVQGLMAVTPAAGRTAPAGLRRRGS